jgi:hypothetical protein
LGSVGVGGATGVTSKTGAGEIERSMHGVVDYPVL